MSLHTQQFFTEHLTLPFHDSAIVGDVYYATPQPDSPLRLRMDFHRTIRQGEYDGLRVSVLHRDQGVVDTTILTFADHGTFTRRDAARQIGPGQDGFARIRDWHRDGEPPWLGADVHGLRRAIERYTQVWFPGAQAPSAPSRPEAPRTVRRMPAAPISGTSSRTR
ncbi:hypothetical protein [Streptomyces celluloflavus]|uniref:hypothetical protein n=1 Tax=Streptomyces celluloflavus TaxID=58344 RepID=UPI0034609B4A|nr:hypothetical protein OG717_29940 [Streptomyces celluloflavus]